jgi:uncharacterized iron-regulated membrane protein
MNELWGILIIAAGVLLFIGGRLKSKFVIYRLLVARSRILWGDNAHKFHQVAGVMVIIFGILVLVGCI